MNNNLQIQGNKILIVWNWSYKNLWDELILLWTIKLLQKENKKIYIAAYDIKRLRSFLRDFIDISKIKFLTEIPKWFRSLLRFIFRWIAPDLYYYSQIDSIIIGWWEILTEEISSTYRYRIVSILPCFIKKIFKKINIYLMWWIQLPQKKFNKFLFNFLLKRTTAIYPRDNDSIQELKDYLWEKKFQEKNIQFFMDTSYFAYDRSSVKTSPKATQWLGDYIIINVNRNGENFLEEIVNDVREYLNQDYKVFFVPMSKWTRAEYFDITYYYKIKNDLAVPWESENANLQNFQALDRESDFEKFLTIIWWAKLVISTRLHLFLISEFIWTPTKVYPYQRKILKMQKIIENLKS